MPGMTTSASAPSRISTPRITQRTCAAMIGCALNVSRTNDFSPAIRRTSARSASAYAALPAASAGFTSSGAESDALWMRASARRSRTTAGDLGGRDREEGVQTDVVEAAQAARVGLEHEPEPSVRRLAARPGPIAIAELEPNGDQLKRFVRIARHDRSRTISIGSLVQTVEERTRHERCSVVHEVGRAHERGVGALGQRRQDRHVVHAERDVGLGVRARARVALGRSGIIGRRGAVGSRVRARGRVALGRCGITGRRGAVRRRVRHPGRLGGGVGAGDEEPEREQQTRSQRHAHA